MERTKRALTDRRKGRDRIMKLHQGVMEPSKIKTVGIPEGLMIFEQKQLWKNFFEKLGCHVVCSGHTTNRIMNSGIELCCNETCLPVKVFTGHAASLCEKVDYIFIPRYASVCPHEKSCPKFCGLPDEVRISLKNKMKLLEIDIDFNRDPRKTHLSLDNLAGELDFPPKTVEDAFAGTVKCGLAAEVSPNISRPCNQDVPIIAVLGHPYMIFDRLLSMNLIGKLQAAGYRVMTPYDVKRSVRRQNVSPFLSNSFFETGLDILGGAQALANLPELVGMVYLSPFACGIDSLVIEIIEHRIRNGRQIPFLKITIDEHSGEAGFDTRLEAFLDMLPTSKGIGREKVI